jgi:hypothetical protein
MEYGFRNKYESPDTNTRTNQSNSGVGVTGRLTEGDLLYVRSLEAAVEILRTELSKYQASDELLNECCLDLDRVEAERDAATADFNEMRDMAVKEMARWAREAGASQARKAKLREAVILCKYAAGHPEKVYGITKNALALPTDDTALKEAIKQGQREILLEAADVLDTFASKRCGHSDEIRRMADEIK